MGRLKRMTEDEYLALKKEYEEADEAYRKAREIRFNLQRRMRWYENSQKRLSMKFKEGKAYQMFGKRKKDLSPEELKEYQRIAAQESRNKKKGVNM